jgi:UDP-glucose 4-epimerase
LSKVLVTGGAGYIAAEVSRLLLEQGNQVVIIDDLSTGDIRRVPDGALFNHIDISEKDKVARIFQENEIESIFHFAAYKQARESNLQPLKYWENNVSKFIAFMDVACQFSFQNFILSSSCSVYGNAGVVTEDSPLAPVSVYGRTKKVSEEIAYDFAKGKFNSVALRYFNVIGASEKPFGGDFTSSCILPSLFRKVNSGEVFEIIGQNYPTPDGTAVRDYIDVRDLARGHLSALDLARNGFSGQLNLSTGNPVSVMQILDTFRSVSSQPVQVLKKDGNAADPAEIWGKPSTELTDSGWSPMYSLGESVLSHWESFQRYYGNND